MFPKLRFAPFSPCIEPPFFPPPPCPLPHRRVPRPPETSVRQSGVLVFAAVFFVGSCHSWTSRGERVESNGGGVATTDGATRSALLHPNVSAVENNAFLLPGKEKLVESTIKPSLPRYSDLVPGGQLEVQLLKHPSKEELKLQLESLHPEIVSFHGEQVNDVVGGLALGDAKACRLDELVTLFGMKLSDFAFFGLVSTKRHRFQSASN